MTWGCVKHRDRDKIFKVGDAMIASTGLASVGVAIQHRLNLPPVREGQEDKWLYVDLPDAIRGVLKGCGLWDTTDDSVRGGNTLIVGWRGRVVSMDCHLASYPAHGGFVAHGSGGDIALGAMAVLDGVKCPRERLTRAVTAACEWAYGCGGEVVVAGEGDDL